VDDASFLKTGLPVDAFDVLIVAAEDAGPQEQDKALNAVLTAVVPHCTGRLMSTSQRVVSMLLSGPHASRVLAQPVPVAPQAIAQHLIAWFKQKVDGT
jgi:hypothetical protein